MNPYERDPGEFESDEARQEWEAKFRWCVHCKADCYEDEPEHSDECPGVTGLWPVREKDLMPCEKCGHPANQMCCMDCGYEFKAGDSYVLRDADTGAVASEHPHIGEVICVGCGAMVA